MTKLPIVSGGELIKILKKSDFKVLRQKGSHVFLKHADKRSTIIPLHKGQDIDRGLLKKILKDINVSADEFRELMKK